VDVSGEPGQAPVVTYVTPLEIGSTYRETIWEGTGPELVDGGPVLFDFWLEDATDASVVSQTYDSRPETRQLTREALGEDLYLSLRGQRVGARVLQVSPASSSGSANFPSVTVLDILPLRASGEPIDPRADLPAVTLGGDGAPSIVSTGTDPPSYLIAQPLIRGSGPQVGTLDTVTFQYSVFTWSGEPIDSSWSRAKPESQSMLDLPKALADGLLEQTVGSQIELVVPPSEPMQITKSLEYKDQTIVLVIDILATRTPTSEG